VDLGLASQAGPSGLPDQRPPTNIDNASRSERLAADAQLVSELAAVGFAGPPYAVFEEELVNYAYPVMMAMVRSGMIFTKCGQRGIRLPRWRLTPQDIEELVNDTLARTLPVFRQKALVEGGWRAAGGTVLTSSFVNFLPYQFANAVREWHKNQEQEDTERYEDVSEILTSPALGPEALVLQREEILVGLEAIESEATRVALVLSEDGYDQDEIADILGDGATRRSVEGLLYRHRRKLSVGSEQEGR
jgi:DNA-directed RNA polymerase specialized sigma24 family protein